jgi:AraC family transcriptional regulator, regulatory protein of adaptative response / DNA-3-methyladenine glycosylase II
MRLDELACYRAISSRDRRFEGRFVVAVTSTGVYCRPGCPAPIPKRENTRFYVSPSAAQAAGFRACLRCRPDAQPANGPILGTGATIRRALRLIEEGALDESSIGELAGRLGVGDRHLRRLFQKHVGASPLSLARSRRSHFARKLIEETELSLADVALSSGFGSIRSFNAAMRETFRVAPNEFRRRIEWAGEPTALRLRLPFKPPLNWPATISFLRPRIVPGVELIEGDRYRRTISVGAWTGSLEVRPAADESCLWLELPAAPPAALMPIVARISRMFDLGADVGRIEQHLAGDDELAPLIRKRPGLRVPGSWDPFELGVRAILGQQVSVAAATTLAARLVESLGTALQTKYAGLRAIFPSPAAIASSDLSGLGIPAKRAEAICSFAAAVRDQSIPLDGTRPPSEVTQALNELPGIGSWTAEYIALRGLHEPDAFPASDLAIRRWLSRERPMGNVEILRRAEAWRPWRAYATIHLWMDGHETENGRD